MSRLLTGICLLTCAGRATAEPASILERHGKQLRADIETAYKEFKHQRKVSLQGNDITDLIQRYLPSGMAFDDAETALRAAGFAVWPRPRPKHDHPQWYFGGGSINPLDSGFIWRVSVWVMLEPPDPNDYTVLRRASGSIKYVSL